MQTAPGCFAQKVQSHGVNIQQQHNAGPEDAAGSCCLWFHKASFHHSGGQQQADMIRVICACSGVDPEPAPRAACCVICC